MTWKPFELDIDRLVCVFFSTNEVGTVDGRNDTGTVSSYRFEPKSNTHPTVMNRALTHADPVHLDISPDQTNLIVAS